MTDLAYGIHAVDVLLRRSPERIISLSVQSDRNDKRIQGLLSLAQNQGVGVDRVSKAEIFAKRMRRFWSFGFSRLKEKPGCFPFGPQQSKGRNLIVNGFEDFSIFEMIES